MAESILKCILAYRSYTQPIPILAILTVGKFLCYKVSKVRVVHYFMLPYYLIFIIAGLIPLARGSMVIKWTMGEKSYHSVLRN